MKLSPQKKAAVKKSVEAHAEDWGSSEKTATELGIPPARRGEFKKFLVEFAMIIMRAVLWHTEK